MPESVDTPTERDLRARRISDMRKVLDWVEAHPTAHVPTFVSILDFALNRESLVEKQRVLGGRWRKDTANGTFDLRQELAPGVDYVIYTARSEVCERVVVGHEEVEVPDPDAPMVKQKREIVEWQCDGVLDGAEGQGRR